MDSPPPQIRDVPESDESATVLGPGARWRLALEVLFLFLIVPATLWGVRAFGGVVPVIPLLASLGIGTFLFLWRRAPGEMGRWLRAPWPPKEVRRVTLQFGIATFLLTLYVHYLEPKNFLALPRQEPLIWGLIVFTYPFLSVLPQELFFRGFFFHRYGRIFPTRSSCILVSAAAFGFAHAFYGNPIAVCLSVIGGGLFAWTFARTRSLTLVIAEHALYGVALFTVGLGQYFFSSGVQVL